MAQGLALWCRHVWLMIQPPLLHEGGAGGVQNSHRMLWVQVSRPHPPPALPLPAAEA